MICKMGETESSTKDLVDKCLEICGGILFCQDLNLSIFSINTVRYLKICKRYDNSIKVSAHV
jgi:hypothetical protein